MSSHSFINSSLYAAIAAILILAVTTAFFMAMEPAIGQAQEAVDITIEQVITGETSFSTNPNSVVMDDSIASITGGTTNGTSTFVVQTNNAIGYNVTIEFEDDPAMNLNGGGANIPDYTVAATETDFAFDTTGTGGRFGYAVYGASVAHVDPSFQDDGVDDCGSDGAGGSNTYGACWATPTVAPERILDSNSPTIGDGATSSVLFRVYVPPNPSPAIPAGTYTATATLTVANN